MTLRTSGRGSRDTAGAGTVTLLTVILIVQVLALLAVLGEWPVLKWQCGREIAQFGGGYHGADAGFFSVSCQVTADGAEFPTTATFFMAPALLAAAGLLVSIVMTAVVRHRVRRAVAEAEVPEE